jgi:transcription termination factor Rho
LNNLPPMTKAELEKKHLSDLHLLAAEAGIEKYRMLSKGELIERLAGENGDGGATASAGQADREDRPRRRRRSRRAGSPGGTDTGGKRDERPREPRERAERPREPRERPEIAPEREPAPEPAARQEPARPEPSARPQPSEAPRPRRRRRRRFGRRSKGVTLQTLLLPPGAGRQALVVAETREGCTALLRGVAADLSADSKGPDPVALLIDPSPEELADWKRDAPQAEIVSAGQPRHASDALAQAAARAAGGEDVILLVDSLTRLAEADDPETAKQFFDAGRVQGSAGGGSLTVVVALERPAD